MRNWIRALRCEDGQALVELAFVIPLVLLFLFGIIDFGLALNAQNSETNIANLAARTAAVVGTTTSVSCNGKTETTLSAWVACEAAATGAPKPTYVCVADTAGASPSNTYTAGDPIKVMVRSNFGWLRLITSKVSALSSTISASATMRLEQAAGTGTTIPFFTGTSTCS